MTASNRDALIEQGQPLVYSIAARVHRTVPVSVELDDLIAYGELGLAEAARDFETEHGVKFTTFAFYRIRGAIYDGLAKMTWTSRARLRRLRYERMAGELLAQEVGSQSRSSPAEQEAAWLGGVTEKLGLIFLASQAGDAGGIRESAIPDSVSTPIPTAVAQREIAEKLHKLLEILPPVEQRLIREVYFEGATLQHAADLLGISKSWASRLHGKALEQLGRALQRIGVHD